MVGNPFVPLVSVQFKSSGSLDSCHLFYLRLHTVGVFSLLHEVTLVLLKPSVIIAGSY